MKLHSYDLIIIIAFLLMISNHAITQFLIAKHTTVNQTVEEAKALVEYVEANPIAVKILLLKKINFIYSVFFAPGMFLGFYYYIRTKYKDNKDILMMFAIMIVSIFFLNFANDLGYLLGFLFR
ncbi:MAG: hypothetical protein IH934_04735 [Nanoarchaeota archaeon]|nr:hypothetical protein [Nanoarchaeota archaeon]